LILRNGGRRGWAEEAGLYATGTRHPSQQPILQHGLDLQSELILQHSVGRDLTTPPPGARVLRDVVEPAWHVLAMEPLSEPGEHSMPEEL
jgi:hypothetical protein